MQITLLTGEYPPEPGGVGDYTARLAHALRATGLGCAVITIRHGALVINEHAADSERTRTLSGFSGLDWSPRCWPAVITALAELRPSWLHIQYQTGAFAMRPGVNLLPWRLGRLVNRPRVAVTFHDLLEPYLFPKAGPARRWVTARLARDADAVVATNAADQAALTRLRAAGRSPATLIPIGSNIPVVPPQGYVRTAWRAQLAIPPEALLVAYFGLLAPNKGVDTLVEALATLTLPWRLLIIGGAATAPQDVAHAAAVRARLAALGLAGLVHETGHVTAAEVSAHLLAADMVALPFRDGASFRRGSLLAALAHGRPLVTTTPADPADAALLTAAASLTPPNDPRALGAAITRLAADAAGRSAQALAGPVIAARYSWEAICTAHTALYSAD